MAMIYDKLNDTLHALPCRIRGLAVSTPESATDNFLARADLRWAKHTEIDAWEAARKPPTEAERMEARKQALAADSAKITAFGNFASAVDDLAAEGVTIDTMSFSGVMAALSVSAFSDTKRSKWGLKLQTLWNEVVFQYDSMRAANAALPLALEILQEQA